VSRVFYHFFILCKTEVVNNQASIEIAPNSNLYVPEKSIFAPWIKLK